MKTLYRVGRPIMSMLTIAYELLSSVFWLPKGLPNSKMGVLLYTKSATR